MKIYIVTRVNEDGWVSIVGTYKTFEIARSSMKMDQKNQVENLDNEGYVPVMRLYERAASITYGNGKYCLYRICVSEVKL